MRRLLRLLMRRLLLLLLYCRLGGCKKRTLPTASTNLILVVAGTIAVDADAFALMGTGEGQKARELPLSLSKFGWFCMG
jgi:hypothetical protein